MFFRFMVFSLAIVFSLSADAQNRIRWNSWDKFNEKVQKADKMYIIYVYFNGCRWCKKMEDETFAVDNIAKFINSNFYAFRLNAKTNERIIYGNKVYNTTVRIGEHDFNEFAVDLLNGKMSFPSILFFDENFKKLAVYDSFIDLNDFEMLLSYYAGGHNKHTSWPRYVRGYCKDNHFNTLVNGKP
ncbi:MAG: DUF255 domain-containing protein [Saprospiraceae bacterium]|nr:MAG: hypothetical protein UZ09_BCD002001445 [Bacteroidetes bacterium OLB9]MCO6463042.1 DUF255 domain-containing protein [Saprospiraceae bacterium]MCZ2337139.1 DUF255 domain-containing protein [Chitinophagales bacterium]